MRLSHAYRVLYCPRYEDLEAEGEEIRENLLAQSTLLNLIRYLFVGRAHCSVELRFIAMPADRSVHLLLLLWGDLDADDRAMLERLLPNEYGWRPLSLAVDGPGPLPTFPPGHSWHEVHLIRRLEFLDLPGSDSRLAPSLSSDPSEAVLSPARNGRMLPPLLALNARDRGRLFQLEQVCTPMLAPLQDLSPDRRRLCEELQCAAPAILSLTLAPPDEGQLNDDRTIAGVYRRWTDSFRREITASGFTSDAPSALFDRYTLPISNLCVLSIRSVAANSSAAASVAQCLCSHLGGMRSFDVLGPNKVPAFEAGVRGPTVHLAGHLADRLDMSGLGSVEPEAKKFLIRAPLLYTLEEVGHFIRLPYGRKGGLPGIETRPVPPFYPPPTRRNVSTSAPPIGQLRIGQHRSSLSFSLPSGTAGHSDEWHTLSVNDLSRHAVIVGATGSGKTVATTFLLRELHRLGIPFLIVEPVKTEYFDRLRPHIPTLRRWRLEGTARGTPCEDFLTFDPIRLQTNVSVARHVSYLKSCFEAAFPLDEVLSLVLENGLRAYYTRPLAVGGCGLALFTRGQAHVHRLRGAGVPRRLPRVFPSFFDFSSFFLERYLPQELDPAGRGGETAELLYRWQQAFRRRFANLLDGPFGVACRRADALYAKLVLDAMAAERPLDSVRADLERAFNPFDTLLRHPAIVELDAVADPEQKALLMAFLLTFLYEHRQAADMVRREHPAMHCGSSPGQPLRHVLVIEEAHRLLSRDAVVGTQRGESVGAGAQSRAVNMFVDLLAEVRAYGQGLIIVEQIPTKLVPEAIKNTNLKLMMRLPAADDRDYLGESMNFTDRQRAFVTNLRTGQMVAFEERLDQPTILNMPDEASWESQGMFRQNSRQ